MRKISPLQRFVFYSFVLYFTCTCFFVLIVLQFCFCLRLQHTTQTSTPLAGFEPTIPTSDCPQTLVLDRSATGSSPRPVQPIASRYTDWANPANDTSREVRHRSPSDAVSLVGRKENSVAPLRKLETSQVWRDLSATSVQYFLKPPLPKSVSSLYGALSCHNYSDTIIQYSTSDAEEIPIKQTLQVACLRRNEFVSIFHQSKVPYKFP